MLPEISILSGVLANLIRHHTDTGVSDLLGAFLIFGVNAGVQGCSIVGGNAQGGCRQVVE